MTLLIIESIDSLVQKATDDIHKSFVLVHIIGFPGIGWTSPIKNEMRQFVPEYLFKLVF